MNSTPSTPPGLREIGLALLVAAAILAAQVLRHPIDHPAGDALAYLSIAHQLNKNGTFTNGTFDPAWAGPDAPLPPGRFFTPLTPAFQAGLMALSPGFREAAHCVLASRQPCTDGLGVPVAAQVTLAAGTLGLIWVGAMVLWRRRDVAWLALLLAAATGEPAYYAAHLLTESLTLPLAIGSALVLACAVDRRSWRLMLAAGVLFGIATLNRPIFAYVVYALAALALVAAVSPQHRRDALALAVLLPAGYLLAVAPWMLRNWLVFGDPGLTQGYAGFSLAQRIAYNMMTGREWLAAFVYWFPDFGDNLAEWLFTADGVRRLGWTDPTSFFLVGFNELSAETLRLAGGPERHLDYLLTHGVFDRFGTHLMVTLPLTWRGLWIAKYWSVVGFACLVPVLVRRIGRGDWAFPVFCLPPVLLAGLHGFTSVSIPRYNLPLLAPLAMAMAVPAADLARALHRRLRARLPTGARP